MFALQDPLNQLPPAASTFAAEFDSFYYFTLWICLFFFLLITGILLFSIIKWRRKTPEQPAASTVTHNTTLEVVWTVIPLIIVMIIFALGWKGSLDMAVAPADCLQYEAVGSQWSWSISHPDEVASTNEMWVPYGKNVRVNLYSKDVLHAFFIPAFRVKRDVLPGRYQMVWFNANKLGTFNLFCAEYCGTNHSYMIGKVHVIPQAEYDAPNKPWHQHPDDPVAWGKMVYETTCKACHSIKDANEKNSQLLAPTWKGIWGREEIMVSGEKIKVDEAYVKESIHEPQKKVVKPPKGRVWGPMTPFAEKKDDEIAAIIAYMKELSK